MSSDVTKNVLLGTLAAVVSVLLYVKYTSSHSDEDSEKAVKRDVSNPIERFRRKSIDMEQFSVAREDDHAVKEVSDSHIIYEVTIKLKDESVREDFIKWMTEKHIKEILMLPVGFFKADFTIASDDENKGSFVTAYHIPSKGALDVSALPDFAYESQVPHTPVYLTLCLSHFHSYVQIYFEQYAKRLREEGMALFPDKFEAKRRILEVKKAFSL
jgi:hypothetical protein